MASADMRYIHPESKPSLMEIKWGPVPDMAGTQLWGSYVREDIIREFTYTGRVLSWSGRWRLLFWHPGV